MFRILLTGTVVIAILGGLFYWRFISASPKTAKTLSASDSIQTDSSIVSGPQEVPKEPPVIVSDTNTSQDLQSQIDSLKKQVDSLRQTSNDTRITVLETGVADLRAQIIKLSSSSNSTSTTTTTTSSSSKSPSYIPVGSGAGPWSDSSWHTIPEYQIVINPGDYSGYTSMQLEVIFRVIDPTGTAKVRLYNTTDSKVISSELSTSSSTFILKTSSEFQLSSGSKTYQLQVENTAGKDVLIQTARIKVNF